MTDEEKDSIVISVPCNVCRAERGQYCRNTATGQVMMRPNLIIHSGRVLLYDRAKPERLA